MNVGNVTGRSTFFHNVAAERPQKPTGQGSAQTAATARTRDRVELRYDDVLKAEKEGYIEIHGERFAVTGEMASQMRRAYDEMKARNEAKMARQTAEANARAARQQAEAAEDEAESMKQAMEIARRISKGGRVPPRDEKFLMEYSQEMYLSAKMMAIMAEEHEKHDTVLEDEEDSGEVEAVDGADTRATVEASLSGDAVEGVSVGEAPVVTESPVE